MNVFDRCPFRSIVWSIVFLLPVTAFAQNYSTYYSIHIGQGSAIGAFNHILLDSGNAVLIGGEYSPENGQGGGFAAFYDYANQPHFSFGPIITQAPYAMVGQTLIHLPGTNDFVGGFTAYVDSTIDKMFVGRLHSAGTPTNNWRMETDSFIYIPTLFQREICGGLYLDNQMNITIGGTMYDSLQADMTLARLNNSNTVLWHTYIGAPDKDEVGLDVEALPNGQSLIAGSIKDLSLDSLADWYVVIADNQGQATWSHRYSGSGHGVCEGLEPVGSNSFMAVGTEGSIIGGQPVQKGTVRKLQYNNGGMQELWHKDYLPNGCIEGNLTCVTALSNGDLLFGGNATQVSDQMVYGWLLRTDATGNIIWSRLVRHDSTVKFNAIMDVLENPSGGFSICGATGFNHSFMLNWFRDVDSIGCGTPNCDSTTTPTYIDLSRFHGLQLYPNPAHNNLAISLSEDNLPYNLDVLNEKGQVVLHESAINDTKHTIDLESLAKGVYFLHLIDSNGNDALRQFVRQ